ncbi:hypothetical protein [Deinococcus sp. Leaf326]|uniref:hypothetical protein n=1 Tax=Deinococcus sp. Leaf326 TaxID=1736338 RepID=UPI0007008755|nr:hypothetical protein [Deinococcus sp. Leaf326]KQR40896.1 hypothetical protein ASF71_01740 [Deinococcus sp. Leaf326]
MQGFLDFLEGLVTLSQLSVRGGVLLMGLLVLVAGGLLAVDAVVIAGLLLTAGALLSYLWSLLRWLARRF